MGDSEIPSVVIQSGSFSCKAGFSGEDFPSTVFPCVVGRSRYKGITPGVGQRDSYIGDEAQKKRSILTLRSPIERGEVKDWDGLEKIWHHTFTQELHVMPEEHYVLLTEAPLISNDDREKMTQIMFENLNVPALYIANQAKLSMCSSGRLTGVIVNIGHGASYAVPVADGFAIKGATCRLDVAGQDLTEYLSEMLFARGCISKSAADREFARDIKEKLCRVASRFQQEMASFASEPSLRKEYQLPDDKIIMIGKEQLQCPEALLHPAVLGLDAPGIAQLTLNSIQKCDSSLQKDMYSNVILSGGSSLFPGLADRLMAELEARSPSGVEVNIIAPPERRYSAWMGGAILPTLPTFRHIWVRKQEYQESGPGIIHQKCL